MFAVAWKETLSNGSQPIRMKQFRTDAKDHSAAHYTLDFLDHTTVSEPLESAGDF